MEIRTPLAEEDGVIEAYRKGIFLIERKNPPYWFLTTIAAWKFGPTKNILT